jgi:hypothetical protein
LSQSYDFKIYNGNASVVVDYVERFFNVEENIFALKTHQATHGNVNFYSAGIATLDRGIGSS